MLLDNLYKNVKSIFNEIIKDDELAKLIALTNTNNPLSQPNLSPEDKAKMFYKNLFPIPKSPNVETDEKVLIMITPMKISTVGNGTFYADNMLSVSILIHIDSWEIVDNDDNGDSRTYKILKHIYEALMKAEIDSIRGNLILDKDIVPIQSQNTFYGYAFSFKYTDNIESICE